MAVVHLVTGEPVQIDGDDVARVSQHEWRRHTGGYAYCKIRRAPNKWDTVLMHRLVMNAPDGVEVDHKYGDKLDNRKSELALISPLEHRRRHAASLVASQKANQKHPDEKLCAVCGTAFRVRLHRARAKLCSAECHAVSRRMPKPRSGKGVSRPAPSGPPRRPLSPEQKAEIRRLHAAGELTNRRIGELFGVSHTTVCNVARGDEPSRVIVRPAPAGG